MTATSNTGAALNPTFGATTSTADGFTVQISNYSALYTWAGTATAGTVSISETGTVTVTGVAAGTSSTATITTTRTGYPGGSATVTATSLSVVSISVVLGVTAPVKGATPVTTITETAQYTGTVSWFPAINGNKFSNTQIYTATITLTAKTGFTLTGVSANFFTVAGTSSPATNTANSGVITAVFPATTN